MITKKKNPKLNFGNIRAILVFFILCNLSYPFKAKTLNKSKDQYQHVFNNENFSIYVLGGVIIYNNDVNTIIDRNPKLKKYNEKEITHLYPILNNKEGNQKITIFSKQNKYLINNNFKFIYKSPKTFSYIDQDFNSKRINSDIINSISNIPKKVNHIKPPP